jgi:hypothetical protein
MAFKANKTKRQTDLMVRQKCIFSNTFLLHYFVDFVFVANSNLSFLYFFSLSLSFSFKKKWVIGFCSKIGSLLDMTHFRCSTTSKLFSDFCSSVDVFYLMDLIDFYDRCRLPALCRTVQQCPTAPWRFGADRTGSARQSMVTTPTRGRLAKPSGLHDKPIMSTKIANQFKKRFEIPFLCELHLFSSLPVIIISSVCTKLSAHALRFVIR